MKYASVLARFYGQPWAMLEAWHDTLEGVLLERATGHKPDRDEILARLDGHAYGKDRPGSELPNESPRGIALIALHGPILARAGEFADVSGLTDPYRFAQVVRAAALDPNVAEIVIDTDSPGGTVSGTDEAADAVRQAAKVKRVTAVANGTAASAAYWITSQATELVITPAAVIGSIGIITKHRDISRLEQSVGRTTTVFRTGARKALGQPEESVTPELRDDVMQGLNAMLDVFVAEVAAGRRREPQAVRDEWADGRTWVGAEAVDAGLADRVGTLHDVLAGLLAGHSPRPQPGRKGASVKIPLTRPDGATIELDTELATAQADAQAAIDAAAEHGQAAGERATRAEVAGALGLEPAALTPAVLADLRRQAEDGKGYRADLEDRLTAAAVRVKGQEAGARLAERLHKAFANLPVEDLAAQVQDLESEADAQLPAGRLSKDAPAVPVPAAADALPSADDV